MKPLILYAAPGAGLGHLVRACAVGSALRDLDLPVRIVTHSLYTSVLGPLTGLDIDFIPSSKWVMEFMAYVDRITPSLVVLDVFPWGIRGEAQGLAGRYPTVFMARRLKTQAYTQAASLAWDASSPLLKRVIAAEPLNSDFESRLLEAGSDVRILPGRIRLDPRDSFPPEPPALTRLLEQGPVRLVVHSGPETEVRALIAQAQDYAPEQASGPVIAILPRPWPRLGVPLFHHFPASVLYPRAALVVTGGGYNSLAEGALCPGQCLHLPFDRRYDDQAGRVFEKPGARENGAPEAARIISAWL